MMGVRKSRIGLSEYIYPMNQLQRALEKQRVRLYMKLTLPLAWLFLLFTLVAISENVFAEKPLTISAHFFPSGADRGIWRIEIVEFHNMSGAKVEFTRSTGLSASYFSGVASLNKAGMKNIRDALTSQDFFELPDRISADAVPLHAPDYRLEVCRDKMCHRVMLYDPERVTNKQHQKRFAILWQAVMSNLPNWPKGWPTMPPDHLTKANGPP